MAFTLSQRSLGRLDGVKNELHSVVTTAIGLSDVDLGLLVDLEPKKSKRI